MNHTLQGAGMSHLRISLVDVVHEQFLSYFSVSYSLSGDGSSLIATLACPQLICSGIGTGISVQTLFGLRFMLEVLSLSLPDTHTHTHTHTHTLQGYASNFNFKYIAVYLLAAFLKIKRRHKRDQLFVPSRQYLIALWKCNCALLLSQCIRGAIMLQALRCARYLLSCDYMDTLTHYG